MLRPLPSTRIAYTTAAASLLPTVTKHVTLLTCNASTCQLTIKTALCALYRSTYVSWQPQLELDDFVGTVLLPKYHS